MGLRTLNPAFCTAVVDQGRKMVNELKQNISAMENRICDRLVDNSVELDKHFSSSLRATADRYQEDNSVPDNDGQSILEPMIKLEEFPSQ